MPLAPTPPSCRPRCCCRGRPAGSARGGRGGRGVRVPRRGHLRHGWHQHRRLPGARRRARAGRRRGPSPGCRCGCRRSTSTRSAPAAGRSPRSTPGGALVVGPESAGRRPRPGLLRPGRRREPTVTDADLVAGRIPAEHRVRRGSADSTRRGARGPSTEAGRRRADGVIAVVDGGHGAGRAGGDGGARRRPARAWPWSPSAGPGPLHACGLADALGMASGDRPAAGRRAVGGRAPRRAPPARGGPVLARPRRPRGAVDAALEERGRGGGRASVAVAATSRSTTERGLPLRGAEPRARGCRPWPRSPPSTSAATATPAPARRSRSWRCGPSAERPRRRRPRRTCRPRRAVQRGRRPRGGRRGRLHRVGARRLAGRARPARRPRAAPTSTA